MAADGIFRDFPFMLPEKLNKGEDSSVYSGFIKICGQDWFVSISLPQGRAEGKRLDDIRLECDWTLAEILAPHRESLQYRLCQTTSLHGALVELRTALQSIVPSEQRQRIVEDESLPSVSLYETLIEELNTIGWDQLSTMSPDLKSVCLSTKDEAGRQHEIRLSLPLKYPHIAPTCVTDLPKPLQIKWPAGGGGSLVDILAQFRTELQLYQSFWTALEEIDNGTWVLEPSAKAYKHCNRRVVIDEQSSLMLEIDPRNPLKFPDCRFLGPQHLVQTYRKKWAKSVDVDSFSLLDYRAASNWDETKSPLQNLQAVLGLTFPSPANTKKEDFSVECGICYSFQLGTAVPNRACENPKCGRPFHDQCLYEWLRGLPNTRQSFNTLFGDCPYCTEQITVNVVSG